MFAKKQNNAPTHCRHCKGEVPADAKRCMHCGGRLKRRSRTWWVLLVLIMLFFWFMSYLSKIGKKTDDAAKNVMQLDTTTEYNEALREAAAIDREKLQREAQAFSYDDLSRYPEKYQEKAVRFTGKVLQNQRTDNSLLVQVTRGEYGMWKDIAYVLLYDQDARVLEDDTVEMWGTADGLKTYTTVQGDAKTVPLIKVYIARVTTNNAPANKGL